MLIKKFEIPKEIIEPAIKQVKDFQGIGHIGEVHLAGDWNNWGDSPEKAGCIRPKPETWMRLEDDKYVAEVALTVGVHGFKPVVVKAEADENGMAPAIWIACPAERVGEYEREKGDIHGNWLVKVK